LNTTLESLQQLIVPLGIEWELVVINNNCTDDTDEVIAQFADGLPIRSLHEKRQGLSNARNCAVDAAKGEYIVWTDDDVIVEPNWLVAYVNAIRTWPNASLFGGPIHLKLEGHSPSWVSEMLCDVELAGVYGQRDLSSVPIRLSLSGWIMPYGPNLCIRTQEQRIFRYNPRIGRCKNQQIRGEETAVVRTMLESGAEGWWVPEAIVRHVITEDLQTQAHVRRYFIGLGQSYTRENPKAKFASCLQVPRLLLSAVKWEVRFQTSRFRKRPKIWLQDLRTASLCWGRLIESLRCGSRVAGW
jgi:glycosyltransferase involved in cell wall biosynthesis